jgi:hypothetical protein
VAQGVGEANAVITSAIARDVLQDEVERMKMLALLGKTLRRLRGGSNGGSGTRD